MPQSTAELLLLKVRIPGYVYLIMYITSILDSRIFSICFWILDIYVSFAALLRTVISVLQART